MYQVSERSTDIDLVREAVHTKRSRRTAARTSESRLSRSTSRSSQHHSLSLHASADDLDMVSGSVVHPNPICFDPDPDPGSHILGIWIRNMKMFGKSGSGNYRTLNQFLM